MTWQPASVRRMPGHVLVGWKSIDISSGKLCIWRHCHPTIHHAVTVIGLSKDFFLVDRDPFVYYVNGRKEVYQTNIPIHHDTFFTPVGRQRDNTPVLLRKLHKLEWLFS